MITLPTSRHIRPVVIYMSYDGMLEPLGESQVAAYLEQMAGDYDFHIISFEKNSDLADRHRVAALEDRLRRAGMAWHRLRYHKRPKLFSTLWDMACALLLAMGLAIRRRARLLHARSILCAAMLYPARLIGGARFVVDIRGFWADERVDAGLIPAGGAVYAVLKAIERAMLRDADHIVTLTHASVRHLRNDERFGRSTAPISVIPTCADFDLFSPGDVARERPLTIGYVGQIGTWYMLEEMLAFFSAVRALRPDARLLIVNRSQHAAIHAALAQTAIDPAAVEITSAERNGVPAQIRRMDAAMALIRPGFSKIASAPTKLAEYLGCGVPVVGNVGCGDMAQIIETDRIGVVLNDTAPDAITAAAAALLERLRDPGLSARCTASAAAHFSLVEGVARYRALYRSLLEATA